MDVIGYARVSTTEQATEGVSLDAQASKIQIYSQLKEFHLVDIIIDAGVSGAKFLSEREGGKRILDETGKGRVDAVITWKLDRLFRDAADCLVTTKAWDRKGIGLHIIDMGGQAIDTSSAMGRMFLTMVAGFAELERNLISERTKSALQYKISNGHRVGNVLYGYDLSPDGKTLIENRREQKVIKLMTQLRQQKLSFQKIAYCLERRKIATKQGRANWTTRAIQLIVERACQ